MTINGETKYNFEGIQNDRNLEEEFQHMLFEFDKCICNIASAIVGSK